MKSRRIALVGGVGVIVGALVLTAVTLKTADTRTAEASPVGASKPSVPIIFEDGPVYALTAANGESFTQESMRGHIYVASFIFTSCPGICPVMTREMKAIQDEFARNPSVHFVSFSVDPATDTPEVLTEYAEKNGANPERWHFLTGPVEDVMTTCSEGFRLGDPESPLDHSSRFILVDRAGRIRGYYDSMSDEELKQLRADIRRLL